jgi:hypothetical protein
MVPRTEETITMTLPANNTEWGFFGTIRHHADQAEAWEMAMAAIQPPTGCPEAAVRDFLDSTHGRHFADDVANGLFTGLTLAAAIYDAVKDTFPSAIEWPPIGLPGDYLPLLATGREAFITPGKSVVGHGGASLEEVVVPLVKIERA